jgi:hypothetical protein
MTAKNLLYVIYMKILHTTYYAIWNTGVIFMRIRLLFTNKTSHCQVIADKSYKNTKKMENENALFCLEFQYTNYDVMPSLCDYVWNQHKRTKCRSLFSFILPKSCWLHLSFHQCTNPSIITVWYNGSKYRSILRTRYLIEKHRPLLFQIDELNVARIIYAVQANYCRSR